MMKSRKSYSYDGGGNDEAFIYFAILADDVFALVDAETRGIPGSGGSSLRKTEILAFSRDGVPLVPSVRAQCLMAETRNNHGQSFGVVRGHRHAPRRPRLRRIARIGLSTGQEIGGEGTFAYQYRGYRHDRRRSPSTPPSRSTRRDTTK
ncbi:MAG: hypothetical protein MZU95_08135 [Desulfomicrobium escambiense]|nr:hypothetical protein [Desulfomicrobium escambiense]